MALSYNQEDQWQAYSSEFSFEVSAEGKFIVGGTASSVISDLTEE
jgi:hypothetical protein